MSTPSNLHTSHVTPINLKSDTKPAVQNRHLAPYLVLMTWFRFGVREQGNIQCS